MAQALRLRLRIGNILKTPTVVILLFMLEKGEARYSQLADLVGSRGTLSAALNELEEDGLISRRVLDSKPIRTFYSLTAKGRDVAAGFMAVKKSTG